jgi:hypothetical protein
MFVNTTKPQASSIKFSFPQHIYTASVLKLIYLYTYKKGTHVEIFSLRFNWPASSGKWGCSWIYLRFSERKKKPHRIGDNLNKPRLVERESLGEQHETKVAQVPFSNCTVKRSISKIIDGILGETVAEMRASAIFAFLFGESTRYLYLWTYTICLRKIRNTWLSQEATYVPWITARHRIRRWVQNNVNLFADKRLKRITLAGMCTHTAPPRMEIHSVLKLSCHAHPLWPSQICAGCEDIYITPYRNVLCGS